MKKRWAWLALLMLAVFLTGICSLSSEANAKQVASGTCGDNLTWVLTDDGTLTISGKGKMTDYTKSVQQRALWLDKGVTAVVIGDGVTHIGEFAFYGCAGIETVTIGSSVTAIGKQAFTDCKGLGSITIPDSVTSIGEFAFYNCTALTSVTLGAGVTSIGEACFYGCGALTGVTIPDSVSYIGRYAFYDCKALAEVTIGTGIANVGEQAFRNCTALTSVTIRDKSADSDVLCSIESGAFMGCNSLLSVTLGNGVKSIGDSVFDGCNQLSAISFPDSLARIGRTAFSYCTRLRAVTLGIGITNIDANAFYGCNIWHVLFKGSDTLWKKISVADGNHALKNATVHYGCVGDEITDLANKVCAVCLANCVHAEGQWQVVTEATCGAEGLKRFACNYCGVTQDEPTPKLECSYGPWKQVKTPTTEEAGLEERVCSACGGTDQRELAKLEPAPTESAPPQPTKPADDQKENDGNSFTLLVIIAGLAVVAIVFVLIWLRRRPSVKKK